METVIFIVVCVIAIYVYAALTLRTGYGKLL